MTGSASTASSAREVEPRRERVQTVFGETLASLAAIYKPDVNVCVARRAVGVAFGNELPVFEDTTLRCLASEGVADFVTHEQLAADVAFVAELLRDLTGADDVGIRVHHSTSPMCARLHVDHIPLRLVCTYVGPGTEWIDQGGDGDCFDCGTTQRRGRLRRAEAGDIVLLKGEGWMGNEGRGAAHRSPAHHDRRLVASFDPLWLGPSQD